MRPSLQGGPACAYRLQARTGGMESLLIRGLVACLCPTSLLSISVSQGMCTGSNFQMVDVEVWLLFPSKDATSMLEKTCDCK